MLSKLALLFLVVMAVAMTLFARPRQGDRGFASRFRLSRLWRRPPPRDD